MEIIVWIKKWIIENQGMTVNLVYSIIALIVLMLLKRSTLKVISKLKGENHRKYSSKKLVGSIYIIIYMFSLLIIWQNSSSFISFLGLFTGGLAIAMKDFIMNIAGGLYILWVRPFGVGDRVEIGGQIGDVIDVALLQFSMLEVGNRILGEQSTGRIIHIPNMQIFSTPLANYEKGFRYIWNEIILPIKLDSNWELAKDLMYEIINEQNQDIIECAKTEIEQAGKKYLIYYSNLTPIIYTQIKDSNIYLTLRYLCEPRQARVTEHVIWEKILVRFKACGDIHIG